MNIFAVLQVFMAIVGIAFGLVYLVRATKVDSADHWVTILFAIIEAAGCTLLIRFFVAR